MSTPRQVIDKLAKLKRLANRPGTPEESVAALEAMQRLMERHRVQSHEIVDDADLHKSDPVLRTSLHGCSLRWQKYILHTLCEANGCYAMFDGKVVHIFGEVDFIEFVIAMHEYLVDEIHRLARDGWRDSEMRSRYPGASKKWTFSFASGAANAVCKRIKDQAKGASQAAGSSALVLLDLDAAEKLAHSVFGRPSYARKIDNTVIVSANESGKAAGGKISLDGQVNAGATTTNKSLKG